MYTQRLPRISSGLFRFTAHSSSATQWPGLSFSDLLAFSTAMLGETDRWSLKAILKLSFLTLNAFHHDRIQGNRRASEDRLTVVLIVSNPQVASPCST